MSETKISEDTSIDELYQATVSITQAIEASVPRLTVLYTYLKDVQGLNLDKALSNLQDIKRCDELCLS